MTAARKFPDSAKPLRPEGGRIPPHDLDAEAAVLSAILLEAGGYELVQDKLSPAHFYADAHRWIYEAMGLLQDVHQPIDVVSVANKLRDIGRLKQIGDSAYLAQITDATPAIVHIESHAAIVIQHARVRKMIGACALYAAKGYQAPDAQEYLDDAEGHISEIARSDDVSRGLVAMAEPTKVVLENLAEADRLGKATGTLTGFKAFDSLSGGLRSGLYIVAGRPGMGKTALALNIATNIASESKEDVTDDRGVTSPVTVPGGGVAFFSLEMTADQLALRAICSDQRLDTKQIRNGKIRRDDWDRLIDGGAWLSRLPLYVDETPNLEMSQLRSRARRLQADLLRATNDDVRPSTGLRLIVVDYLQIMGGWRKHNARESREEFIADCARSLKSLSKELNVPVMCLAQLNRDATKNKTQGQVQPPQLDQLRESGAIEQEADMVLFVHRDDYYDEELEPGIAKLVVAKQRGGSTGTCKLRWQGSWTRFDNLAPDEEYDHYDDF